MHIQYLILAVILSILSTSSFAEVVNINKADAAAFQHYLSGIGEKKAKRIIQYRTEHKEFKHLDDIMKVQGIGDKIFAKIKQNLSLTKGAISISQKKTIKKTDAKKDLNIDNITKNNTNKTEVTTIGALDNDDSEASTTKE